MIFFLSNLAHGSRALSYRIRADASETFHAMPTKGYAMYAPILRALSAESTLIVKGK